MKINFFNQLLLIIKRYPVPFYLASLAVYLVAFFAFIEKTNGDYSVFLEPWFRNISNYGFWVLREDFYNYAPAYMYLLALATLFPFKPVIAIKLLSLPMIPLGGYYMTRLVARFNPEPGVAWLGFTFTLLTPTLLLNSADWGQADVFYGVAALACVTYLLYQKPYAAMVALGVGLAIKSQIIFLGPFILLMLIKKQIPWKSVWIPPAIFALMATPLLLIGKPALDILTVYLKQAGTIVPLCVNCTNLWSIFPNIQFEIGIYAGFILALIALEAYLILMMRRINTKNPHQVFLAALLSVMILPFFLPLMHERFFYIAEMLSIGVFFVDWRFLAIPLLLQISTINVYLWFLQSSEYLYPRYISGLLNLVVIGLIIWLFLRHTNKPVSMETDKTTSRIIDTMTP